ncbi:CD276 antigen homolog [Clarias gariepinus]|uniref:CD276 antigen homolog n=1 Tax=Clarias gariepinus TaxID=13013 RepID=UPI00234C1470|nr:CD276 antigen homolog [Clarias gariepinus]
MFDGNMHARYFFFTFLLVVNRVSSQNVRLVKGTLGGSVVLPCSSDQSNTNVYWRYSEKITVCDIIKGEVDFDEQDPVFKDRVESFSSEFAKGNFSIKLKNLKKSDEGVYTCNFPKILTPGTLKLIVTENRIGIVMRGPYSLVLFLLGCILLL